MPFWLDSMIRQANRLAPFQLSSTLVLPKNERDAAKKYFQQRVKENPKTPLVRIDNNRQPAYDPQAIKGAQVILEDNHGQLLDKLGEVIEKRESLPSGSNFFAKLSGKSRKIHEAERQLDEARRKIEAELKTIKSQLHDLNHLPELPMYVFDTKVKRKQQKLSRIERIAALKRKVTQVL